MAQTVKNPPAMWENWVPSLGWEDPLEKGKATHSSILAWRIPSAESMDAKSQSSFYLFNCSLVAQMAKNPPAMWENWAWSLAWEDPLEEGMATHSSILAWRIPWTEEPGGLPSMGSQRVGHDWVTKHSTFKVYSWKSFGIYVHLWNHYHIKIMDTSIDPCNYPSSPSPGKH